MRVTFFAPAGKYDMLRASDARRVLLENGFDCDDWPDAIFHFRFAGTDHERAEQLKHALCAEDDVALAVRGGYGVVRLLDQLDALNIHDARRKWVVGFSDITALHAWIHTRLGWPTLHATMANGFLSATSESLLSLYRFLHGEKVSYSLPVQEESIPGHANGVLVGGNLAVLHGLLGSPWMPDTAGRILFLEEIGEQWYKVDRMLWSLNHAGKLHGLKGVIVGDFTDMPENDTGLSLQQMVLEKVPTSIPVWFGFPAGHGPHNLALRLNAPVIMNVDQSGTGELTFP